MVELGEDEEKFEAFMIPLTTAFESLGQVNNFYDLPHYSVRITWSGEQLLWSPSLQRSDLWVR